MKCPHCQVSFHPSRKSHQLGSDADGFWFIEICQCPACNKFVLELVRRTIMVLPNAGGVPGTEVERYFVRPKVALRPQPPSEVPEKFSQDYGEASLVIGDSPQASAAISRRCLQHLLRDVAGVKPSDLAKEIDEVLASKTLPSHLAEAIDAIRNIGNFAAHPIKSQHTGEVLPVEPGEAEWNLDVLDGLFDFYFVQPALLKKKRDALNVKLAAAKKPPLK
jgi:hypothetical protein